MRHMEENKLFSLDRRGVQHVRRRLSDMSLLCAALHEVVISEAGETFTLAPSGTPIERLYQFEAGGLLPENLDFSRAADMGPGQGRMMEIVSLFEEQVARLRSNFVTTPGLVCIVNDPLLRWRDIPPNEYPAAFAVGEEVYHLLTSDLDGDVLVGALSAAPFWNQLSAQCLIAPDVNDTRMCSAAELRKCAASVIEIMCDAYDGEGFVVWRRTAQ